MSIVYGTLVSFSHACALSIGRESEELLFIPPKDLEGIDLDQHLNAFSRWQAVPIWGKINVGHEFQGRVAHHTLRRAQDVSGQLQLINEKLRQHKMDLVLFDGKRGWVIGVIPKPVYYDAQRQYWFCPYPPIHRLLQNSLKQKR